MKRYVISKRLIKDIKNKNSKKSLREMNQILGFEIRNILYKNSTISEKHLRKLEFYFNKKFNLKRVYLDYGKNLNKFAITKPIKSININGNLAELIGIMLGDGNIWNNRIRIAFDKRKMVYVNYTSGLFKKIFGIEFKREINENTNQLYLYCNNLLAVEKLIDFGLNRGNKIKNNLGVPSWIKEDDIYTKRCLRGLIDTDGCVYFSKRDKQIYIKFTSFNKQLLKDFKNLTDSLSYHFAKANNNNWCLYRKDEVRKFINEIKPLKAMGS